MLKVVDQIQLGSNLALFLCYCRVIIVIDSGQSLLLDGSY